MAKEDPVVMAETASYAPELVLLFSPQCSFCVKFKSDPNAWPKVKKLLPQGVKITEVNVAETAGRHKYMHPTTGGVPQVAFVLNGKPVDWHIGYTKDAQAIVRKMLLLENAYLQKEALARNDGDGQKRLQKAAQLLMSADMR